MITGAASHVPRPKFKPSDVTRHRDGSYTITFRSIATDQSKISVMPRLGFRLLEAPNAAKAPGIVDIIGYDDSNPPPSEDAYDLPDEEEVAAIVPGAAPEKKQNFLHGLPQNGDVVLAVNSHSVILESKEDTFGRTVELLQEWEAKTRSDMTGSGSNSTMAELSITFKTPTRILDISWS